MSEGLMASPLPLTLPGLDPGILFRRHTEDRRVKPGEGECMVVAPTLGRTLVLTSPQRKLGSRFGGKEAGCQLSLA